MMRPAVLLWLALTTTPAFAQSVTPPFVDPTTVTVAASKADTAAAQASAAQAAAVTAQNAATSALAAASSAQSSVTAAQTVANAAKALASTAVQTVNGTAPVSGNAVVSLPAAYTDAQAIAANTASIATVQANLNTLSAQTPQFVALGVFITQATLRATYPCVAASLGRYARVSDTYGTVASVAICETDGSTYYWRPQRTDYATTSTQTAGTLTLTPFVSAPTVYLSQTPTANLTITPSATNAWPGASFHLYMPATIALPYTISLGGLIGGGTLTALQGRDYILTYTASGWKSN